MNELIEKNPDGKYVLTEKGDQNAYLSTTKKLSQYYLTNNLSMNGSGVQTKISGLPSFLEKNFHNFGDYLQKLDLLAEYLEGQKNPEFSKFMGKYFLSTLEKEKQALIQRELPKVKEKLDNPFYAPGNAVLEQFAAFFNAAGPLIWPPRKDAPDIAVKPTQKAPTRPVNVVLADPSAMPGKKVLEQFGVFFKEAKTLNLSASQTAPEPAQKTVSETPAKPVIAATLDNLPGRYVLEQFGKMFKQAPAFKKTEGEEKKVEKPGARRLISFQAFVSLQNAVTKFSRNKDMEAYKSWYQSLKKEHQLAIQINNGLIKEKQSIKTDWNALFYKLSYMQKTDRAVLERMKYDLEYYQNLLKGLRTSFQIASSAGEPAQVIQSLYAPVIKLLDSNASLEEKKVTLQMTLLQLSSDGAKEKLIDELTGFLNDFDRHK